jgi:hypothetical protein
VLRKRASSKTVKANIFFQGPFNHRQELHRWRLPIAGRKLTILCILKNTFSEYILDHHPEMLKFD